jgi:hypothetical protein
MGRRRIAAVLVTGALIAFGCYSPNIRSGGFACGDGGACPDNFQCNPVNHLCYPGPHDAAVEKLICKSDATVPQVCPAEQVSGQMCNPGCQTGCGDCGWCAVVAGATTCLTGHGGTKTVGDVCDPANQTDCAPGLYCQPQCGTGRCGRFCDSSDATVCGTGSTCSVAARKSDGSRLAFATLCSLVDACDPVSQMGCPSTAFACYPGSPNECDCTGTVATGQGCPNGLANQCIAGDSCFGIRNSAGDTTNTCLPTCKATADCKSGGSCMGATSTLYGYCM